jgi:hypothetical protein
MSFDVEGYVAYKIANAPILKYPFPHFFVESVFPEEFYRELRARLPELDQYQRLDETGTVLKGSYPERFVTSLTDLEEREFEGAAGSFWAELNSWFLGEGFAALVMEKFRPWLTARFGDGVEPRAETDGRLVRDFTNYSIAPHTDTPRKLASALFYLPPDESLRGLGTSIYIPKDPSFRCDGTAHHSFEKFRKVMTMEYRPNSVFAFVKTERAFHGVDKIAEEGVVRDVLLYNLYLRKLVSVNPPAPSKTAVA